MPSGHNRIPADNDCSHCHHFPPTRTYDQLAAPGVLNGNAPPLPIASTTVEINGTAYAFDPSQQSIETVRPDVFAPGFFSLFDVILAVAGQNGIGVEYEYDDSAKTHWINSVDGVAGDYWYRWNFDTGNQDRQSEMGWKRNNRWDENLWRPGVAIRLSADGEDVAGLKAAYRAEIQREQQFGHVVGAVSIASNPGDVQGNPPESGRVAVQLDYTGVAVTAHNIRTGEFASPYLKPLQPGVVTVMDIALSLQDQGELDLVKTIFYDRINGSYIDAYFVQALGFPGIGVAHSSGSHGFVCRTHLGESSGFEGINVNDANGSLHIPLDLQVIHSPDYSLWRWMELGSHDYADDLPAPLTISGAGIANAASYAGGTVAPGEIVVIYGSGLGPAALATMALTPNRQYVTTALARTRVRFDDVYAPIIYTSARQVSAVVPYSVAGQNSTTIRLEYQGDPSNTVTLPVSPSVPGIFTLYSSGSGQGAILNQDYSVNGPANPAAKGTIVMLYVTGAGQTDPQGQDGKVIYEDPPRVAVPVSVKIGGVDAELRYAGAAPGMVSGVVQINVRVPASLAAGGAVPVEITVGGASSQPGVTLSVEGGN
jgi:uncharacterized protein (TIGR03437 family)